MITGSAAIPAATAVQRRTWRPVLVDVTAAMLTLRVDAETVYSMVDAGELRWVWNVSAPANGIRDLRFWFGELLVPAANRDARPEFVVEKVIGHPTEENLRATTVCNTLLVRRPSVLRLLLARELSGQLQGNVQWITRASLRGFLLRRLIA